MGRGIVWKTLRDQRGVTIGMSVSMALIALGMIALFPQIAEEFGELELPPIYDALFGEASIATPAGFLATEFFGWIPLLIIAVAVIAGTASIASEEANGTLELLLAEPITRRAILLRKAVGLGLSMAIICIAAFAGMVAGAALIDEFTLGLLPMFEATVLMLLVTWFFLALSILASAALPGRATAAVVVTGAIVAAYLANLLAGLLGSLDWLARATPFGWTDYVEALLHGLPLVDAALLIVFTVAFLALAVVAFEARDIGAAGWPWRRKPALQPEPGASEQSTRLAQ